MPSGTPPCTIARGLARRDAVTVSYDETRPPTPPPPPQAPAPPAYAPAPQSGTNGWLIAFVVVVVVALGVMAALIISKGDSGQTTATIPTVTSKTTTVQSTTTVTTPATSTNVTVAPNVTLSPSGTPEPAQSATTQKTSSTP